MAKTKYCQDCGYPNPDNLIHCFKCKHDLSKPKGYEQQMAEASWKYYIVNEDGSMSAPYILSELERVKNNGLIDANTFILKDGEEEERIAGALFDFNVQSTLPYTSTAGNTNNYQDEHIPEEIKGLNWGAFLNPLFWSICHNTYVGLLCIIFYFPISILLLIKGNEWGWKNRHFDSIEQFKKVQHKWLVWGIIPVIVIFTVYFLLILLSYVFIAQGKKSDVSPMPSPMMPKPGGPMPAPSTPSYPSDTPYGPGY